MSILNPTPAEMAAKQEEFKSAAEMNNYYAANPQYNPLNQFTVAQQAALDAFAKQQAAANPVNTGTSPSQSTVGALGTPTPITLTSNASGTKGILDPSIITTRKPVVTTGGTSALGTGGTSALGTGGTSALGTSQINTAPTGSIPALTTADLASWGNSS